jgi:hypothetical protein
LGNAAGADGAAGEAELEGAASGVKGAGSRAEETEDPIAEDGPRPVDVVVAEARKRSRAIHAATGSMARHCGMQGARRDQCKPRRVIVAAARRRCQGNAEVQRAEREYFSTKVTCREKIMRRDT